MAAKIVVADDSRTQRSTISLALERKGYQVIQAGNGLEAITLVYRENPDLLVSDIVMPDLTGYQVCRLLKNDPITGDLPIVLLTTLDHQEHRFWGKEAGADSYVLKATVLAPLEKEIARLLVEKKRLPNKERRHKESPALARQGAQARLTDLLDRLLFEATVANRIREIGRFSGSLERSLRGFFEFFQDLLDYQVVLLCLRASTGPLLIVQLKGTVTAPFLETVKEKAWKQGLLNLGGKETVQEIILNPECLSQEKPADETTPAVLSVPFSTVLEEGGLAVFKVNPSPYTEEAGNTLKIAARELEPILKFNLQAEAIEKLKADFTAMIVHDLRSPLTVVLSFTAILEDGLVGPVNEEQKRMLGKLGANIRNLVNFVSDFLDLSKLEAGRIELTKKVVDLDQLIRDNLDNFTVLVQDKKISLRCRVPPEFPTIIVDPRRLGQVLENLVSNAIKFTPEGGEIEVGASQEGTTEVKVWVKDNGVGITAQEIDHLFEKYRQTTSGKYSNHKGTGLGLVICKMIVQSHGGRIWVESEEGKGTSFFFSLPLNRREVLEGETE
ncbi:MAG: hybrid sensor histidine kinase/response regulator [Deltaproteobacteria bacterium]|nr:hybrid sensor histidine kinase/response regulator [Deltaproteobacteria bacterium]